MNLVESYAQQVRLSLAERSHTVIDSPLQPPPGGVVTGADTTTAPNVMRQGSRTAKRAPAPALKQQLTENDLEAARQLIHDTIMAYLAEPDPGYVLLIPGLPGLGKTTAGVIIAEWVAKQGKRLMYAGPRHDFFPDILKACAERGLDVTLWYEWLARQWNMADPALNTCRFADYMAIHLQKGLPSKPFCENCCGREYMKNKCRYLAQSKVSNPLIFAQHQHVTAGNPLASKMAVLMVDEDPRSAFRHDILIPGDQMQWKDVPYTDPLAAVLHMMEGLARAGATLSGYALMQELGIDDVIAACEEYPQERLDKMKIPSYRDPKKALEQAYHVLPILVPLLLREAYAARDQRNRQTFLNPSEEQEIESDYNERIYIHDRLLEINARHAVAKEMPAHIIQFDATAQTTVYEGLYQRPVRILDTSLKLEGSIHQVISSTNSKGSLINRVEADPEGAAQTAVEFTAKAHHIKTMIEKIIEKEQLKKPVIIVPKALREFVNGHAHFYANRGTNQFQDCDGLILAGTPMPPRSSIEKDARSIWYEQMEKFDNRLLTVERAYQYIDPDGEGWVCPVYEYADPYLQALLWLSREAEIIQSAHRARILLQNVPVYLLTNLPIDELPPTRLLTNRDIMDAPEEVNIWKWAAHKEFVEALYAQQGYIQIKDLVEGAGMSDKTARKYIQLLLASGQWQEINAIVKTGAGTAAKRAQGRPTKRLQKTNAGEIN